MATLYTRGARNEEAVPPAALPPKRVSGSLWRNWLEPAVGGIPLTERMLFYRQMATLTRAGITLYQAVSDREARCSNRRLRTVLQTCRTRIETGGRLSDALAEYPLVFDELQIEMLRASEEGGFVPEMLRRIADQQERELEFRRFLHKWLLYPKILLFAGGFLLPLLLSLLFGDPARTLFYLTLSFGLLFLQFIGGTAAARVLWYRSSLFREGYERLRWSFPGVGDAVRKFAFAKFARATGMLYAAGVPLSRAVTVGGRASGSSFVRAAAERVGAAVGRGESIGISVAQQRFFPAELVEMFATGERTGDMEPLLANVAEHLENEAETRARKCALAFAHLVYLAVILRLFGVL